MDAIPDAVVSQLDEIVKTDAAASAVITILPRVIRALADSGDVMAWDVVPLGLFGNGLPDGILSCWIFVIRAGAETGAERHPNSHQRSYSLIGSGTFELRAGAAWRTHPLCSDESTTLEERWVSIPPAMWHRLFVGPEGWAMLSFHTVRPEDLIEEKPVDPDDLDGETHQERYDGRR